MKTVILHLVLLIINIGCFLMNNSTIPQHAYLYFVMGANLTAAMCNIIVIVFECIDIRNKQL